MSISCGSKPAQFHICNIENLWVRAALETAADLVAHMGARTIAACKIEGFTRLFPPVLVLQGRHDVVAVVLKGQQFRLALDLNTESSQPFNQQLLMPILGINENKRV